MLLWSPCALPWEVDRVSPFPLEKLCVLFLFIPKHLLMRPHTAAPQTAYSSQEQATWKRLCCGSWPSQKDVPCKTRGTAEMGAWKSVQYMQQESGPSFVNRRQQPWHLWCPLFLSCSLKEKTCGVISDCFKWATLFLFYFTKSFSNWFGQERDSVGIC